MRLHASAFEDLVAQAVDELPAWVREHMDNVAITVMPWPSPQQMRATGRPSGFLLGLYEGVPLTQRGRGYNLIAPDRITLFQRPLELYAQDIDSLRELIRSTIIHEIAHHFGFSEAQIHELGE